MLAVVMLNVSRSWYRLLPATGPGIALVRLKRPETEICGSEGVP